MRFESAPQLNKEQPLDGLPSLDEVRSQMRAVNGRLTIKVKDSFRGRKNIFPAEESSKFSQKEYNQFKKEFHEDLQGLVSRLQRLKLRLLLPIFKGTKKSFDQKSKNDKNENNFAESASDLYYELWHDKKPFDNRNKAKFLSLLNRLLPPKFKIVDINKHDLCLAKDFLDEVRYGDSQEVDEKVQELFKGIFEDVVRMETQLEDVEEQTELFARNDKKFVNEERVKNVWDEYRKLLKLVASYEELGSWYSPTYGSSGKGQKGKGQHSAPFRTDYQRFRMPEMKSIEYILGTYSRERKFRGRQQSILFNSGLNALQAILLEIDQSIAQKKRGIRYVKDLKAEAKKKQQAGEKDKKLEIAERVGKLDKKAGVYPETKVFKTRDIYFEVDSMLGHHFGNNEIPVETLPPEDADAIVKKIKDELPTAVFLNPMSNMYEMRVTDISKILKDLCDDKWFNAVKKKYDNSFKMYIVIDNSTLGRLANWATGPLSKLPPFIKLISFESLVKYAQDGQEITQAGLITTYNDEYGIDTLDMIRSRLGFMPPESIARKLKGATPPDITDTKMARHTRNAKLLGSELEKLTDDSNSFVSEVVFPGLESHSQHDLAQKEMLGSGGLMNLGLDYMFLNDYREILYRSKDYFGRDTVHYSDPINLYDFEKKMKLLGHAFEKLALVIAKHVGLEINQGTSYGFHTTRIAVYERHIDEDKRLERSKTDEYKYVCSKSQYVRISVGTENVKDLKLIAEVLKRANDIMTKAKKEQKLFSLCNSIMRGDVKFDWYREF